MYTEISTSEIAVIVVCWLLRKKKTRAGSKWLAEVYQSTIKEIPIL